MNTKQKKSISHKYLGFCPALLDVRKKEILRDNINIEQWQANLNFLIYKYGSTALNEKTTFDWFAEAFEDSSSDCTQWKNYLEENVTPVLTNISDVDLDLPGILCRGKDRNWFLAGYPDVFEYFHVKPKLPGGKFDIEMRKAEASAKVVTEDRETMEQYVAMGKVNQAISLVRMKTFYKKKLKKRLLLCRRVSAIYQPEVVSEIPRPWALRWRFLMLIKTGWRPLERQVSPVSTNQCLWHILSLSLVESKWWILTGTVTKVMIFRSA